MEQPETIKPGKVHLWVVLFAVVGSLAGLLVFLFVFAPRLGVQESVIGNIETSNEVSPSPEPVVEVTLFQPSLTFFQPQPVQDYSAWDTGGERLPDNSGYPRAGEAILYQGQLINTPLCSAGFYVFNKKKEARLITAEHCGFGEFSTRDGARIGETADIEVKGMDVQLIAVEGAVPYVRHFNTMLPIVGEADYKEGDRVCRTGAATGTVCNLVVRKSGGEEVQYTTTGRIYEDLIKLQGWEPTKIATTVGDSGGVVYKVDLEAGTAAIVGVQVAGDGKMLCYEEEGQTCYRSAYVVPVEKVLGKKFRLATVEDLVGYVETPQEGAES